VAATNAQVRKLMEEYQKHGGIGRASMRAGMDRKTARKYVREGKLPSELKKPHTWRTREDPFEDDWPRIEAMLGDAPELEAVTVFDHLLGEDPDRYEPGQLRTLQRRVRQWRAQRGPDREVFFAQEHRPGEAMQTDFTNANELEVTIGGEPFDHMLCHSVLPYSNWDWATVCHSESIASLRRGVQSALFRLGKVPEFHQIDNSTAATHRGESDGKREFNVDYLAMTDHFGLTARTIGIGEKEQNGDVEAGNRVLKRRLGQHLLLRGTRDFESTCAYEGWLWEKLDHGNRHRGKRFAGELEVMRKLSVRRLPEYQVESAVVTSWSTIRIKRNTYSVPSRLIGETLRAHVYDQRIEIYYRGRLEEEVPRLPGEGGHRIDYRHVIWSLVQKPGAFPRYRYREDLFPSLVFRRAYDALCAELDQRKADIEYLRILHLAASTMETAVEAALDREMSTGKCPRADVVKAAVSPESVEVPEMPAMDVDLSDYDSLLAGGCR
jgi:Mu transposase, C-terminal domain